MLMNAPENLGHVKKPKACSLEGEMSCKTSDCSSVFNLLQITEGVTLNSTVDLAYACFLYNVFKNLAKNENITMKRSGTESLIAL